MESIDRLREWLKGRLLLGNGWNELNDIADAIEREHKQTLHDAVGKAHADGERNALRQVRSASEDYRRGLEDGRTEGYALAHTTTKQEADAYAEMESFHDRLCRASERREDVTLWGVDYTPYPLDADGVPIRAGDVMEERSGHTFEVASLMAFGGSDNWLVLSDPRNFSSFREPHDLRHHAPTVEDVLEEFVARWMETHHDDIPALKAEYAAKLTLRGDE